MPTPWWGPLTGGLAVTGVVSSAMFGTICGSAPATAASIGSIVAPDMEARGYSKRFTGSIIAASGLLGIIIPPSIVMVNYGATAGVSIGSLFIGGIIPGIMGHAGLAIFSVWQSKKYGYGLVDGHKQHYDLREILVSFKGAILPLTTPLFILGASCMASATATEAAVISVVWSALLTVVVYREITVKELCTIITDGVGKAGQIIGMMASSAAFGYALTVEKVPALMANFFVQYVDNALIFFLITFAIVLIFGCFLEVIAIIVLDHPHPAARLHRHGHRPHPLRHVHVPDPVPGRPDSPCGSVPDHHQPYRGRGHRQDVPRPAVVHRHLCAGHRPGGRVPRPGHLLPSMMA